MLKSKIAAAALAALTLASVVLPGEAQARPRFGLGFGIAAGALLGATIASGAYGAPGYYDPGYRRCRFVRDFDAYGYPRVVRVCGADIY
jgi:hypothetical protein